MLRIPAPIGTGVSMTSIQASAAPSSSNQCPNKWQLMNGCNLNWFVKNYCHPDPWCEFCMSRAIVSDPNHDGKITKMPNYEFLKKCKNCQNSRQTITEFLKEINGFRQTPANSIGNYKNSPNSTHKINEVLMEINCVRQQLMNSFGNSTNSSNYGQKIHEFLKEINERWEKSMNSIKISSRKTNESLKKMERANNNQWIPQETSRILNIPGRWPMNSLRKSIGWTNIIEF